MIVATRHMLVIKRVAILFITIFSHLILIQMSIKNNNKMLNSIFILYCRIIFALVVLLFSASLGIELTKNHQKISPTMLEFIVLCPNTPQPCWNGIIPGITNLQAAKRLLAIAHASDLLVTDLQNTTVGYAPIGSALCYVSFDIKHNIITHIVLVYCDNARFKIKEVFSVMGSPSEYILVDNSTKIETLVYDRKNIDDSSYCLVQDEIGSLVLQT